MRWSMKPALLGGLVAVALGACGGSSASDALEGATEIPTTVCDPATGSFSTEVTNPYLPYRIGQVSVLEGDEGSKRLKVQISVLPDIEIIAGVTALVVEEREWEDDELIEVSRNFVAQAADGSVCYFGEDVDDYRDGEVMGHGGAWRVGDGENLPGMLMPGDLVVGTTYPQEIAPGIAEDAAIVIGIGESFTTPAGVFENTARIDDVDVLGNSIDPKRYAPDVGLIVDESLQLMSFSP